MAPPRTRFFFNRDDPELNVWPEKGYGYIYMYTFRNGKRYIGQTIRSVAERTVRHRDTSMKVDEVIRSGAKFTAEILAYVPVAYLNQAEYYCISKFGTLWPDGYNFTNGGDREQLVFTEEARRKISEGVRRRNADPQFRKKMAEIHQRIIRYSEKDIICLETGKVYGSITKASKDIGCTMGNISAALRNAGTANGYHFIHFTRYNLENREDIIRVLEDYKKDIWAMRDRRAGAGISKKMRPLSRPVRCLELNRGYANVYEAEEDLGVKASLIRCVCNGERGKNTTGGYHFIWDSEYASQDPDGIIRCLDKWKEEKKLMGNRKKVGKPSKKAVPVRCMETNEVFPNAKEAGKRFGCSASLIHLCLVGRCKTARGYHFERLTVTA